MVDRIATIQLQLQRRIARSRGNTSSDSYNDTIQEIVYDLANLNDQWNNRLVSLTADLPDGTVDADIDAFTDGLSGTSMYVDADATATYRSSYYNSGSARPNTIYEQLAGIYAQISNIQEDIEEQIDNIVPSATGIILADVASIYTANNVEDALAEAMAAINQVAVSGVDLSAVAQHYHPAQTSTYDIGNNGAKMRAIYVGTDTNNIFIGSGCISASALLQLDSTAKGFLPPRMTAVQRAAIAAPAAGLIVYDSTASKLYVYTSAWEQITSV